MQKKFEYKWFPYQNLSIGITKEEMINYKVFDMWCEEK